MTRNSLYLGFKWELKPGICNTSFWSCQEVIQRCRWYSSFFSWAWISWGSFWIRSAWHSCSCGLWASRCYRYQRSDEVDFYASASVSGWQILRCLATSPRKQWTLHFTTSRFRSGENQVPSIWPAYGQVHLHNIDCFCDCSPRLLATCRRSDLEPCGQPCCSGTGWCSTGVIKLLYTACAALLFYFYYTRTHLSYFNNTSIFLLIPSVCSLHSPTIWSHYEYINTNVIIWMQFSTCPEYLESLCVGSRVQRGVGR